MLIWNDLHFNHPLTVKVNSRGMLEAFYFCHLLSPQHHSPSPPLLPYLVNWIPTKNTRLRRPNLLSCLSFFFKRAFHFIGKSFSPAAKFLRRKARAKGPFWHVWFISRPSSTSIAYFQTIFLGSDHEKLKEKKIEILLAWSEGFL